MPNPFFYGGRVNPEQFVGRRAELRRIFAGLEVAYTGQMQSFSVVGPRRIGKSSLLFYVAQRYAHYLTHAAPYRFAYIELQDAHCHTLNGLLDGILKQLDAGELVGNRAPLVEFQDALLALKARGALPVICLDEFEELIHRREQFTFDFYESLRYLMNQHALAFITASKSPLIDFAQTLGYTSPFFNIFTHLPLGELNDDEARTLLARGANSDRPFSDAERRWMYRLAGRHPYKLQLAGYLIYEAKADGARVDWKKLRREFQQQIEWVGLGTPIQKTIRARLGAALRWLIAAPELLGRAILESILRIKKDNVSNSTAWIVGAGVIVIVVLFVLGVVQVSGDDIWRAIERVRGK